MIRYLCRCFYSNFKSTNDIAVIKWIYVLKHGHSDLLNVLNALIWKRKGIFIGMIVGVDGQVCVFKKKTADFHAPSSLGFTENGS